MEAESDSQRPPPMRSIFGFAAFNALSFQMVLGSPMVLYAKSLNASATVLGLIAGMLPLLVILQIPAARHVDRVGFKRFVLSGWTVRTVFVAILAVVPLLSGAVSVPARLALVLVLLFLFNVSRGISSCGWLPWITSIIPSRVRGRYLTREAAVTNLASFLAFWIAAAALGPDPAPWRFSVLFAFSAATGAISLWFLSRIPEERAIHDDAAVPARPRLPQMLRLRPFAKLLVVNVTWSLAIGGVTTFTVAFLKGMAGLPEREILMLTSALFLGGAGTQVVLAPVLDRLGSKPVMIGAAMFWVLLLAFWSAAAGGAVPTVPLVVGGAMFAMGLASSLVNLSNVRLAMEVIPERGRSHYFAVYSVVGSVVLGLAPVLWGIMVDHVHGMEIPVIEGTWALNRYSLLFCVMAALMVLTVAAACFLEEPQAMRMEDLLRSVLERSRARFWLRSWFRPPPRA